MRLAPETIASLLYLVGAGILVLDAFLVVHRRIDEKSGAKKMLRILGRTGAKHTAGLPASEKGLDKRFAKKTLVFAFVGFFVIGGFLVETCAGPGSATPDEEPRSGGAVEGD
jgi:hypothetical protein